MTARSCVPEVKTCAANVGRLFHCAKSAPSPRFIAYERVFTARQGQSRLGLEAPLNTVDSCAGSRRAEVPARFTEVESGRNPDLPELGKAIHLDRLTGAFVVIVRLEWLSRNAAFLLTPRNSGLKFFFCNTPEAKDPTLGIIAHGAQREREAISVRMREALSVAKAHGAPRVAEVAAKLPRWGALFEWRGLHTV